MEIIEDYERPFYEEMAARITALETAIQKFSDGLKHYDGDTIKGLDQLRAALRQEGQYEQTSRLGKSRGT